MKNNVKTLNKAGAIISIGSLIGLGVIGCLGKDDIHKEIIANRDDETKEIFNAAETARAAMDDILVVEGDKLDSLVKNFTEKYKLQHNVEEVPSDVLRTFKTTVEESIVGERTEEQLLIIGKNESMEKTTQSIVQRERSSIKWGEGFIHWLVKHKASPKAGAVLVMIPSIGVMVMATGYLANSIRTSKGVYNALLEAKTKGK